MRKKLIWLYAMAATVAVPSLARADDAAMPPLIPIPPSMTQVYSAIWVLISFVILLVILKKMAWKNVLDSLKGREQRIAGDIRAGEEARAKAEALLKEHAARIAGAENEVRKMLEAARADGEKIAANIKDQAQADAQAQIQKAKQEIDQAQRQAVRQVYEKAAEMATDVAAKIIGRELRPQDQQDLVTQTLGQLDSIGKRN